MTPTVQSILRDHVSLTVTCLDRIYVNGYVPTLQTPGSVHSFLREHRGNPLPSPALFAPMREALVRGISRFADEEEIAVIQFERGQRKDDIANARRAHFHKPEGVVFIGVAQEKMASFRGRKGAGPSGGVYFDFTRSPAFVNHYYFYIQDPRWGPAFLKYGSYLPYPVKLCLNGHEWVKQRLREEGLEFRSLDNGFLSCANPERLQVLCDSLGPAEIQGFFDRWSKVIPWPLLPEDREAGFDHKLALWQLEVSETHVFDKPVQGRLFFDEVIRENLDLGRPDRVSLLFDTRTTSRTPPPYRGYRTRVIMAGVDPSLHIEHRKSHVKQYFKLGRALRTETTINDPADFRSKKSIDNLEYLRNAGSTVNRRLLEAERIGQNCRLTQEALDNLQTPTTHEGQRAPAMRFGDARVMAMFQALTAFSLTVCDFRNADLRGRVASLLGLSLEEYTPGMMTYDLRRLRLKGLIVRVPGTHRYRTTTYGLKAALFLSKVYRRVVRPGWPDDGLPEDRKLARALAAVTREIDRIADSAKFQEAA